MNAITNTNNIHAEIFALMSVLVLKLLSRKVFFINKFFYKTKKKLLISRLLFQKIAHCTGKLQQNYK